MRCKLPKYYRSRTALRGEEDAAVWLWAQPSLLDWPAKLEWLFSPVTGNTDWLGDLWEIDENGELLIVESKKLPLRRCDDPFADFLTFQQDLRTRTKEFTTFKSIFDRWNKRYDQEINFGKKFGNKC